MKVQLEKTFPMPASAETAWALLQDIEGVAGCMPGAKITERIDDAALQGHGGGQARPGQPVVSRRGRGQGASTRRRRTLHLFGKGTDTTGSSGASMDLTARVEAVDAATCNLVGTSEVSMSGKAATFGGRMMGPVADQVLKQFAANFAAQVQAMQAQAGGGRLRRRCWRPRRRCRRPTQLNGLAWSGPSSRTGCARCSRAKKA